MRTAIVVGILWGAFCGLTNGLPLATTLAQMAVPWVWIAAFAGHRASTNAKTAAALGGVSLLTANIAYFAISSNASGLPIGGGARFFALWAAIGLVIGPMGGLAGWWMKSQRTSVWVVAALTTISIAEPLALWAHIDHLDAHLTYAGVATAAIVFTVVWARPRGSNTVKALIGALLMTYPAAVALEAVLIALQQVSPPMRLI